MSNILEKQCSKCVLDTTVEDILFNEEGICNYCLEYEEKVIKIDKKLDKDKELKNLINTVKESGKNNEYDCIIGLSGGVDSTYLLYWAVENGLRPLAVHIDTGWNSELAVCNIENAVKQTNVDLYTHVIDWEEMKDLQLSFFKASVPDCDVPQDHVFSIVLNRVARKNKISYSLSGHNNVTEFILPKTWSYDSNDLSNLLDIHKKFGKIKLKKYPKNTLFNRVIYYKYLFPVKSVRPINFLDYNKSEIKKIIQEKLGWRDYGGKHYESKFTKFFQAYYLPEKFGYDKRKAHLSNLIVSGQLTKQEALEELNEPLYSKVDLNEDLDYVTRKLGISTDEWELIMKKPKQKHTLYKSDYDKWWYKLLKKLYVKYN
ncbi:N-acetyl sugar amidotransferase [Tenacibaculum ovolyticum]|uniref:N-acetyl sugar amidotransferase n=1 Tax=Tenacibaculum ovolyticum TaxID=104270 RepID=UPI003BA85ABF